MSEKTTNEDMQKQGKPVELSDAEAAGVVGGAGERDYPGFEGAYEKFQAAVAAAESAGSNSGSGE